MSDSPAIIDRILYVGSDHLWALRRVSEGIPLIPTSAKSQIRSATTNELWIECSITISQDEGWIYISIPESATADDIWTTRLVGHWDIEVVYDGRKTRWVEGVVEVSQEVTLS